MAGFSCTADIARRSARFEEFSEPDIGGFSNAMLEELPLRDCFEKKSRTGAIDPLACQGSLIQNRQCSHCRYSSKTPIIYQSLNT